VDDITSANRGVQARRLRRGQRLVIPTSLMGTGRVSSVSRASPSRGRVVRRSVTGTRSAATATAPAGASRGTAASRRVHIVRSGETPWQIAQSFNVSLAALLSANGLTSRSRIHPGQALRIPN